MAVASVAYNSPLNFDPNSFDASVTSLLMGMGGEQYIEIFKSRNISQETLMELTDEDLEKLGVDNEEIRASIIKEIQNFPMYETILQKKKMNSDLDLTEIYNLLRDSNQHLHRIYLSMISINLAIKRTNFEEVMIENRSMPELIKNTLNEVTKTLNNMDKNLRKSFKYLYKNEENRLLKKIVVGTVGTAAVAVLSVLFVRSLKNVK